MTKKLSERIFEVLDIHSFTQKEIDKVMEWRKLYTDDEIIAALKKSVKFKAKRPLTDYTTKILEENCSKDKNAVVLPKYYQKEKEKQEKIKLGIPVEEEEELKPADPESIRRLQEKLRARG